MDPQFADHLYSTLKVKVPYKFLNWENDAIKARAVWGTDVYTDDSDIVAGKLYHHHLIHRSIE